MNNLNSLQDVNMYTHVSERAFSVQHHPEMKVRFRNVTGLQYKLPTSVHRNLRAYGTANHTRQRFEESTRKILNQKSFKFIS